jgi:hypothetical protein
MLIILFLHDSDSEFKETGLGVLVLIDTFSKVTGCKISIQKSLAFLHVNNKYIKKEIRKTIPFTAASRKET